MGKTVVADENVQNTLLAISKKDGFTPGLIIGQPSEKKDFAIHVAPTRRILEDSTSTDCCVNDFGQIEDGWLKIHFKNVTRSLSGGLYVLGFFIVGPKDIINDKIGLQKVRSLVSNLHSISKSNVFLYGSNQPKNIIVLHFCSKSKKFQCKSFDVQNMSLSMTPVNWKFVQNPTSWFKINCSYKLETLLLYKCENKKETFDKRSKEILQYLKDNIDDCLIFVHGFINNKDTSYTLEEMRNLLINRFNLRSKVKEEDLHKYLNVFKAEMFKGGSTAKYDRLDFEEQVDEENYEVDESETEEILRFAGHLSSHVYLNRGATLDQAVDALKEDLLRSMAARLDLHCDSLEDSSLCAHMIHMLPRRVAVKHKPKGVLFTDYMFPDDTNEDIVNNIKEQLGIDITPESIIPMEKHRSRTLEENNDEKEDEKVNTNNSTEVKTTSNFPSILVYSLIGAFIVLIISLSVQFLM